MRTSRSADLVDLLDDFQSVQHVADCAEVTKFLVLRAGGAARGSSTFGCRASCPQAEAYLGNTFRGPVDQASRRPNLQLTATSGLPAD